MKTYDLLPHNMSISKNLLKSVRSSSNERKKDLNWTIKKNKQLKILCAQCA